MNISYPDGDYELTYEFLRVFSPSADVQGHTPDQAKLQVGKRDVTIVDVAPVGEYALKLTFSDGHDSGIYSWEWLEDLGKNKEAFWAAYLAVTLMIRLMNHSRKNQNLSAQAINR